MNVAVGHQEEEEGHREVLEVEGHQVVEVEGGLWTTHSLANRCGRITYEITAWYPTLFDQRLHLHPMKVERNL